MVGLTQTKRPDCVRAAFTRSGGIPDTPVEKVGNIFPDNILKARDKGINRTILFSCFFFVNASFGLLYNNFIIKNCLNICL